MKVCFDHQVFTFQRFGGISRYFYELYRNFSEVEVKFPVLFSNNSYINSYESFNCLDVSKIGFRGSVTLFDQLNKIYIKPYIQKGQFDIFHPTYYDPYFVKTLKKPYILTVHDMTHELFHDHITTKDKTAKNKKVLVKNAAAVIAVSDNTKKDLIDILGVDKDRIHVVYHGVHTNNNTKCNMNLDHMQYVLFVGERFSYKNFKLFLKAFKLFEKEISNINLICVGKPFNSSEKEQLHKLSLTNKAYSMHVDDTTLNYLYSNAMMLVYPSLYEGFGMPILEAFSAKCPVVASNTSCFPEIGGDAALYFDPMNEFDLKDKMVQIVNDTSLVDELKVKGYTRARTFSWKSCADQTTSVYNRCQ